MKTAIHRPNQQRTGQSSGNVASQSEFQHGGSSGFVDIREAPGVLDIVQPMMSNKTSLGAKKTQMPEKSSPGIIQAKWEKGEADTEYWDKLSMGVRLHYHNKDHTYFYTIEDKEKVPPFLREEVEENERKAIPQRLFVVLGFDKIVFEGDEESGEDIDFSPGEALSMPELPAGKIAEVKNRDQKPFTISDHPPSDSMDTKREEDVLRILCFFSGEMSIHTALMHLNPDMVLEIYYDAKYFASEYEKSAEREGLVHGEDYFNFLGGKAPTNVPRSEGYLKSMVEKGYNAALGIKNSMVAYGIDERRIRLVYTNDILNDKIKKRVSETHSNIARRYHENEPAVRKELEEKLFHNIIPGRRAEIMGIAENSLGLNETSQIFLLWVRLSGLAPGGAYPELDTNMTFLRQMIDMLKTEYSGSKIFLVGDNPGDQFTDVDDRNLVKLWSAPYKLNWAEQGFLLNYLNSKHKVVSIGMESGAIEMPALLGVRTIYLERSSMRGGKSERWTYVSGAKVSDEPGGEAQETSGPVSTWRRQQFEAPTEWAFHFERLGRILKKSKTRDLGERRRVRQALRLCLSEIYYISKGSPDFAPDGKEQIPTMEITSSPSAEVDWYSKNRKLEGDLFEIIFADSDFDYETYVAVVDAFYEDYEPLLHKIKLSPNELKRMKETIEKMKALPDEGVLKASKMPLAIKTGENTDIRDIEDQRKFYQHLGDKVLNLIHGFDTETVKLIDKVQSLDNSFDVSLDAAFAIFSEGSGEEAIKQFNIKLNGISETRYASILSEIEKRLDAVAKQTEEDTPLEFQRLKELHIYTIVLKYFIDKLKDIMKDYIQQQTPEKKKKEKKEKKKQ